MALVQSCRTTVPGLSGGGGVQETRGESGRERRVWTGDNRLGGEQCRDGWNPNHTVGECWGQKGEKKQAEEHSVVGLKQQDLEELEG